MSLRIEDYAVIGDCHTAALVGKDGSIDWLCWPRFDSSACFAALLGGPENGRFLITPKGEITSTSRKYRDDTLILETEFETAEGAITLIDFMPAGTNMSDLTRIVVGRRGRVQMRMELILRFDYGDVVPWVSRLPDGAIRAIAGPDMTVLRTKVEMRGEHMKTVADFVIEAGEEIPFVLTHAPSHLAPPSAMDVPATLRQTEGLWRQWADRCPHVDGWSARVRRSLITLKALTYAPTGGIVAAATTSLPELIGGERNWDYRYCWLRDATLTLLALMNANYTEEATAWRGWLQRAIAGSPEQLQIMYGIGGERRLEEFTVPWLKGYENSSPVRVGNAAAAQIQLDVYGEVMDALHQARKAGLPEDPEAWAMQRAMLDHLSRVWKQPDAGMWEVRGPPRHFTYSKVMAWVAVDRAIQDLESIGLHGPARRWHRLRDEIHADVCANGYSEERKSFVQSYGSKELDASCLLIPLTGFLPPEDARVVNTIAAIESDLTEHGLVLRYRTQTSTDGLPPGEGMFLACSFWMVSVLVQQKRRPQALKLFEDLLSLSNDLGLYAEEYDPIRKRMVGNFPQAFTHVAMIGAAFALQPEAATMMRSERREGTTETKREPHKAGAGATDKVTPETQT